jgi:hypothetical protein
MQDHHKQAIKDIARAEDNFKCTSAHFENVLNLNDRTFNFTARSMYFHLWLKYYK